jgi:transposase InsO family protein
VQRPLHRLCCSCVYPKKRASFVAFVLQDIFSLVGYPSIFHTDNGKEFTGEAVVQLLRDNAPSCVTVTGRPRTPRDQGSVENINRQVRRTLQEDDRRRGTVPNWTKDIGRMVAALNDKELKGRGQVAPYKAVFGMDLADKEQEDPQTLRTCKTVADRLQLKDNSYFGDMVEANGWANTYVASGTRLHTPGADMSPTFYYALG